MEGDCSVVLGKMELPQLQRLHVVVRCPLNSGSQYFNYKHTFSVVLLACVDADYRFIIVNIETFSKVSDDGIFAASNFGKHLSKNSLNISPNSKF